MRSLGAICLGLILASSAGAHADVPPLDTLPQCKVYEIRTGGEVCGFDDLEDVRAIALADAELTMLRGKTVSLQGKGAQLALQVGNLETAVKAQKQATEIMRDRNVELTTQLIKSDREHQLCRVRPRWGGALAWSTAAVLGALLAGFVAHDALN
ncbi:MAG: hypothetical protein V3U85_00215 [Hyphomicrobium sp.]